MKDEPSLIRNAITDAIGSEPHDPSLDTAQPWRRAMQGHAVSNIIPVVGANRTGFEPWDGYPGGGQTFYGSSFIADHRGLPRRELRQGYHCGSCGARFTVPLLEDGNLRRRARADREAVAQAVGREWARGVTINLDKETFRRLLLETGA